MKKIIVSLLAVMVALVMLAGCQGATPTTETSQAATTAASTTTEAATTDAAAFDPSKKTIAIVMYPTSNPTCAIMGAGFMQTAADLGYNAILIGGDTSDVSVVYQMIDSAMAQYDIAGMAFNAYDETGWKELKKITDAGVPVCCCWNEVSEEQLTQYDINPDMMLGWYAPRAYDYGYEAGKVIGEACNGTGTLAVTESAFGATEDAAALGFKTAIQDNYPNMKVLDPQLEGLETVAGISVVTSIIQANPDLVGAFGTTGTSAQTWAAAKENTGWEGYMIGMDFTAQNLDLLESGAVYGIVAQPIYDAWGACATQIDKYLRGEAMTFDNPYDAPIIYKADVEKYRAIISDVPVYQSNTVVGG